VRRLYRVDRASHIGRCHLVDLFYCRFSPTTFLPAPFHVQRVSAFWLVVVSVASVTSRSTIGITALIVAASAVQSTPVVSPALVPVCLAKSVTQAACFVFLANVVCECSLCAVSKSLDFIAFKRTVVFALSIKRLKIRRQRFDCLIGQFLPDLTYS
jgi:hypothetical protein